MRSLVLGTFFTLVACGSQPHIPTTRPVGLTEADLVVAGIAYGADSSHVHRLLGPPLSVDFTSWTYDGLRIWFLGGKVKQIALTTRGFSTRRGLRLGDPVTRLTTLYGPSCTKGAFHFCRTIGDGPDERGIVVTVENGVVTDVRVGAVFDLE